MKEPYNLYPIDTDDNENFVCVVVKNKWKYTSKKIIIKNNEELTEDNTKRLFERISKWIIASWIIH